VYYLFKRRVMRRSIVAVVMVIFCVVFFAGAANCGNAAPKEAGEAGGRIMPKMVRADTDYDGKADRTEYYDESGAVTKIEIDQDGDGVAEETIIYKEGKPVKGMRDTNKDGKPDTWIDF
jgi:hypothetical protein